jgi:tetratricopeptide (TPR) repeat protein
MAGSCRYNSAVRHILVKFKIPLVVLGLAVMAAAVPLITGYTELSAAESAQASGDHTTAAVAFEAAAKRLIWRADLWERAGENALLAGRPEETIRILEGRSQLSRSGQLTLAQAYLRTSDLDAALNAYQTALSEFGGSAEIFSSLAAIYRARNDVISERAALQNQLLLAPDDAAAHYRLGLLLTLSDSALALEHLLLASGLDPDFDPVVQTLRTTLNLSTLEPGPSERWVTIGRGLGLVSEWQLAVEAFDQAVRADANNAEAWAWLGEAKQHLGQGGSDELDRALALNPESVIVRALRGLYWKRVGNLQEALFEYQTAAELDPANPAWKTALGETYARLGDLVSALGVYQRATELAPGDASTWRLLATFCAEYSVQVREVGLPAAHKAVELAQDDPVALDVLGWNQLSAGLFLSAEKTLLSALEIAPDYPAAHLHIAMAYLQTGDRNAAYQHLLRVRELDPEGTFGEQAELILAQNFQ